MDERVLGNSFDSTDSEFGPAQKGQIRSSVLNKLNQTLDALPGLTALGRNYIAEAVKLPPAGNSPSSSGRYASIQMGVTLAAPHRFLGMAVVDTLEHDPDIVFFGEATLPLKRENSTGKRKRAYGQRPDFIVVRAEEGVLVDVVPLAKLEKQEGSGIYERSGCVWTCPSAEQEARKLGLRHEVWSDYSISPRRLTNTSILADYFASPPNDPEQQARCALVADLVLERGVLTVTEALQELRLRCTIDDIFHGISRSAVYVDLGQCELQLQHTVRMFASKTLHDAYYASQRAIQVAANWRPSDIPLPRVDQILLWDGIEYQVKHIGVDSIELKYDALYVTHDLTHFRGLLQKGVITALESVSVLAEARLKDAEDCWRRPKIEPLLRGVPTEN